MGEEIEGYKLIGEGYSVVQLGKVRGIAKNADIPQDILKLIAAPSELKELVIVTATGTATFVAPVLGMGVKGIVTYAGTPECHLGIVGREFRIPLVLSLELAEGADLIADGTELLIDCTAPKVGRVYGKA